MKNEKRLIDANAFKIRLEEIRQDLLEEDTMSSDFAAGVIETVQDEYLQNEPTVDAVEVVRCKDCRYWEKEYGGRYISACTFGYCNECKMYTIDNYFCAYGGRKDNGTV